MFDYLNYLSELLLKIDNLTLRLVNPPRGAAMSYLSSAHFEGVADAVDGADQLCVELSAQAPDV